MAGHSARWGGSQSYETRYWKDSSGIAKGCLGRITRLDSGHHSCVNHFPSTPQLAMGGRKFKKNI